MRVFLLLGCAALAWTPSFAQDTPQPANPAPEIATVEDPVDPDAVAALRDMSGFLQTLQTFKLTATTSLDVVTAENQKVQMDSVANYQVKRPGIRIDLVSDMKTRQYFYDGQQFTINAPQLGYYATVPAPPTNKEFLAALYERTGIELPLEDLFRWADEDTSDIAKLKSAFNVGTATIDGVRTDHWAFRTDDFDWEVWIQQGDQPLPRKLVIVDRTDPMLPMYSARLAWELNPTLDPAEFTFSPGPGAIAIQMASAQGVGQ